VKQLNLATATASDSLFGNFISRSLDREYSPMILRI
jgi:hypothetical protein